MGEAMRALLHVVNALDNYYNLMNLRRGNQQARYAETLTTAVWYLGGATAYLK